MFTQDISQLNPNLNPKFAQMSEKYVLMDSEKLVNSILSLTSGGKPVFELRSIQFRNPRNGSDQRVGNHLIRIQTINSFTVGKNDKVHPEMLIKNSYDGAGQFEVRMGIFRLVCSNGLVIPTHEFGEVKLRHMGTPEEAAFDLVKQFAANLPKFQEIQQALVERQLTDAEKVEFAMKAAKIRFDKEFTEADAEKLLEVARPEDDGNDMWKVFNRIQEKLMGKGFKGENMKKAGKPITRATEDLRINSELFQLALSYIQNDPEGQPQDPGSIPEDAEPVEIADAVEEVADLVVEIPARPEKTIRVGGRFQRNPAYDKWEELYGDLV